MNGSTVGVAGLALAGLGFAGAGMLPQGSPQATSPDPVAWAAQLRAENVRWVYGHRYDTRPAGGPLYVREAKWWNTPLGGGDPWIAQNQ